MSLTPAGEIFVAQARFASQHLDRAVNLSRAAIEQAVTTLHVGKSPYTGPLPDHKASFLTPAALSNFTSRHHDKLARELTQDLLS